MARKEMSDLVLDRVLRTEGGYVDHPADRGGETYRGIARNFHPDWRGWGVIDEMRGRCGKDFPACLDRDDFLQAQVRGFYLANFWRPIGGGLVDEYQCAHRFFDMAVNMGVSGAVRAMQNALRLLGRDPGPTDGVMGPRTGAAIRAQGEAREGWVRLELVLRGLQARHYVVLAERDESQRVFLVGWLRRAWG
jgi:lysozyme family protein